MGVDAAPFLLGIIFIVVFAAPIRGLDGVDGVLFRKIIPLHDPAHPVLHRGADKYIDQVRITAEHIIAASPYNDTRAFLGQRFNDNGLGYIGAVVEGQAVSCNRIRLFGDLVAC